MGDKLKDIRRDDTLLVADIICLTETWLLSDEEMESLQIPGFRLHLNSSARGKGIATYGALIFDEAYVDIKREKVQITRLSTPLVDVINIYRSQGAKNVEVVQSIKHLIRENTPTIICGDLNLCSKTNRENHITSVLQTLGFEQLVREASHLQGGHLDHVYSNLDPYMFKIEVQMYSPYYTCHDHDGFLITITHQDGNKQKRVSLALIFTDSNSLFQ